MPYIKAHQRQELRVRRPLTSGELNYAITKLCNQFLGEIHGYSQLNEVIGVLECAKLELYRRMVAVYEDKKCAENGDVYGTSA